MHRSRHKMTTRRESRIALCGAAAVSAAHHHAYLEEYDTRTLTIVAVRLAQLAQSTCDDGMLPVGKGL